ncbi:Mitochondrial distribution and morphology protein 10 [Candida maltosa Xu316]|uniref:Mitochondrial distribution and morphology protein 10 n=1 Tax=Candida maltosa (strain Xu316) TaxID=1245528 RepID=M3HT68_CANMX|nr:Mitochondrial distribution and morphology protein 10 [Candida maltosa Xu316]
MGTKDVSLQDAIAGFRIIEPLVRLQSKFANNNIAYEKSSLLYGRMYFPGSALEAMIIKRLNENTQLLIKCVNNPHLQKNGTMIVYLQNNTAKYSREFIYSTNESLFGLRCLYNLGTPSSSILKPHVIPKFDNSVVSIGTELWFAANSMSPGLSSALRYSTRSTSTGKPLTMTLAINPILGHISSTYTVKTSVASTFCSKYDFNFFSYASNLSIGFELYSYANKKHTFPSFVNHEVYSSSEENKYLKEHPEHKKAHRVPIRAYKHKDNRTIINPIQNLDNVYHINPSLLPSTNPTPTTTGETVTTAFQNLVKESDFSSVLKFSTSLNDKVVKILWEGRLRDFLVSTGVKISLNPITNTPEFNKLGISFSYAL